MFAHFAGIESFQYFDCFPCLKSFLVVGLHGGVALSILTSQREGPGSNLPPTVLKHGS